MVRQREQSDEANGRGEGDEEATNHGALGDRHVLLLGVLAVLHVLGILSIPLLPLLLLVLEGARERAAYRAQLPREAAVLLLLLLLFLLALSLVFVFVFILIFFHPFVG